MGRSRPGALLADKRGAPTICLRKLVAFVGRIQASGCDGRLRGSAAGRAQDLAAFLKQLSAAFAPHGWIVVMAVPFDDDNWPYAAYAQLVDYTLLMAYDEHDDSSGAGSIAGQSWFENTLDKRMRVLAPRRTIVSIGSYAYDWNGGARGQSDLRRCGHRRARLRSEDRSSTTRPTIRTSPTSKTTRPSTMSGFSTRVTAFNEIHAADIYRPAGYALWRLGSEDPSIWSVMGRAYGAARARRHA